MSDDNMTYEPVQTVAQLAARVQELERELSQADNNTVALAARNAELRARLDAVPVRAMGEMMDAFAEEGFPFGYKRQRDAITLWLDAQAVQP